MKAGNAKRRYCCRACQCKVKRAGNDHLKYPYVFTILHKRECIECGKEFITDKPEKIFCQKFCTKRNKDRSRRALKRNAYLEDVSFRQVATKSNYTCQLCNLPVDCSLSYPDPFSSSIDHIIPLSRGGMHCLDNCQLAHLRCNVVKSNSDDLTAEQKKEARKLQKKQLTDKSQG